MLKALELVGFKSFADKTRLEFPRGITVVVGPNGSGKSNIVDAIKWVLGEQSVKSLRGKEMADCIFNGSGTRRALNCAETTLTFDNSERLLDVDTPEVQITRRVYRNGEGEYLINRQPCRLRDIRDLFAGTGVATEAYSIIEQGKVDVLLQSSPRDRRLIFEEAAGISRFKAKKIETMRRLERVEQNLLRLSDIVDEVDSRVRGVRAQAAKARRFKEYADRLQQLRTQVGLADWRTLSKKLAALDAEVESSTQEIAGWSAQADALEARGLALELQIAETDQLIRSSESRISHNRERIASHESTIEHEQQRCRDLEEEISRHRRQLAAMSVRVGDLELQVRETATSLEAGQRAEREAMHRLAEQERGLTKITTQLDEVRAENEQRRTAHLETLRTAAALGNQIGALEARVSSTTGICERDMRRLQELAAARESVAVQLDPLRQQLAELTARTDREQTELKSLRSKLAEQRGEQTIAQRDLASLRERHSAAAERASVLEELEKRLEGLSAGVKEVLVRSRQADAGPFKHVCGLVADLLHVSIETAPLIEVALGESAQHLVVSASSDLVSYLQQQTSRLPGRTGFIRLDVLPASHGGEQVDLQAQPGVMGRADRFVETAPEYAVLARRLLGRTWIVEQLSDAVALAKSAGRGVNFVTQAGELLAADGTLTVGPRQVAAGLISRRSELRALRQQVADLSGKIEKREATLLELNEQIAEGDRRAQDRGAQLEQLTAEFASHRLATANAEQRHAQLDKQHDELGAELTAAQTEHDTAMRNVADTRQRLTETESSLADLERRLNETAARSAQLDHLRQRHGRETSAAKIDLAKIQQQLDHLRAQQSQLERDQQERGKAVADSQTQLARCLERSQHAQRSILRAESEVAWLYLEKEGFAAQTANHLNLREDWRVKKTEFAQEAQRLRARARKLEAKLHAKELAAGEVRHERSTLADRLREDYSIDLAALEHEPSTEELHEREAVEQEITELRMKINSIGGVNLDALAELEEMEARFASLSSQHADVSSAKASLEQIIHRINADSRRLFAETLEVVREHFQVLFRKLFGGGQADIVLDEGIDILESGIEIVARPPGKEPRNISLLSGGEKTLTCVALLLAIFRSRPSPFCVLDEVDAALDEANIERFIAVLNEFLAWTQFIVVTHSKKTMTCAHTLYGITMQESGVSKRVSVRFEDVSDNGEITQFQPAETDSADAQDGEIQAA